MDPDYAMLSIEPQTPEGAQEKFLACLRLLGRKIQETTNIVTKMTTDHSYKCGCQESCDTPAQHATKSAEDLFDIIERARETALLWQAYQPYESS